MLHLHLTAHFPTTRMELSYPCIRSLLLAMSSVGTSDGSKEYEHCVFVWLTVLSCIYFPFPPPPKYIHTHTHVYVPCARLFAESASTLRKISCNGFPRSMQHDMGQLIGIFGQACSWVRQAPSPISTWTHGAATSGWLCCGDGSDGYCLRQARPHACTKMLLQGRLG